MTDGHWAERSGKIRSQKKGIMEDPGAVVLVLEMVGESVSRFAKRNNMACLLYFLWLP